MRYFVTAFRIANAFEVAAQMTHRTHRSSHGEVRTIVLDDGRPIKLLPPSLFEEVACLPGAASERFRVAPLAPAHTGIAVTVRRAATPQDITRDAGWRHRCELWRLLRPLVGETPAALAHHLPLTLLTLCNLQPLAADRVQTVVGRPAAFE